MDELNQHECMTTMSGVLKHMHRNEITPNVEEVCTPLVNGHFVCINCKITPIGHAFILLPACRESLHKIFPHG